MKRLITLLILTAAVFNLSPAAPIAITFRHYPTSSQVQRAYLPGSFNNWGPNANGVIAVGAPSLMTWVDSLGCFIKSYTFNTGTEHNYKIHEHRNASGSDWQWLTDPLNPLINTVDNNNSLLRVEPQMLFQISPRSGALITDPASRITFGAFVAAGDSLLASASTIAIDGEVATTFTPWLIPELGLVRFPLPALNSGPHCAQLRLVTRSGAVKEESVCFTVLTGAIHFMTPSADSLLAADKSIRWKINRPFAEIKSVTLYQSGKTAVTTALDPDGDYERRVTLARGRNTFVAAVTDQSGATQFSDTLRLRYPLPQHPVPAISLSRSGDKIRITGSARDPQNGPVTYTWALSPLNPAPLPGIEGRTAPLLEIDPPQVPGDYAVKLVAADGDGYSASAQAFFTVRRDSSVLLPGSATVAQWVRDARIYCLFFKSFTAAGTIDAALERLDYIKALGFNTLWVLPVMDVEGEINQFSNIGYNIVDFYSIDRSYGSGADFKNFVAAAHSRGLRVILDVTPNHSSRSHPAALDARALGKYSRYYDFYQHEPIDHDTNGLGQSLSSDGIVYYSGFSDALLNWNWSDAEARSYMIEVYKHWLREYDLDGFRFDVWWGPHRRYGRASFDTPLRLALRAVKSDILILGETAGTGSGTEENYADQGGGMDMGYDWSLFGTLSRMPGAASLHNALNNSGFRPGPNSFYLRFLENQDEDRVIYRYGGAAQTMPVAAALLLSTGTPLLYAGQEVGMGLDGANLDLRRRGTIDWANPLGALLQPHYQKLAWIRAQFPAFNSQFEESNGDGAITGADRRVQIRLDAANIYLYALGRPWQDANGLALMNFSPNPQPVKLPLRAAEWMDFSDLFSPAAAYYLNDLYAGGSRLLTGAELDTLRLTLPPYGAAVYTIATRAQTLDLPDLPTAVQRHVTAAAPQRLTLAGSYPNPFNNATAIRFALPAAERVMATLYNARGQQVRMLLEAVLPAGEHEVIWDGRGADGAVCPSGLYFLRLRIDSAVAVHKMALVR